MWNNCSKTMLFRLNRRPISFKRSLNIFGALFLLNRVHLNYFCPALRLISYLLLFKKFLSTGRLRDMLFI